ncbi:50S ribosome-binding GTPase [Candidatus Woesearchaeota archaeon]|nr:50S ribosome-binding GTPase [Candidatus Woesearchaeota archaeon]
MGVNFWKIVDSVISQSDIVLMVIDARLPEQTRNSEIERKVKASGKTLITVINKADLVDKDLLEPYKKKFAPCVFVSAHKFYGMTLLRRMILRFAEVEPVTVGVVGYPNTGKSSVINALKGRGSAPTAPVSGYTKGKQNIKIDNKIKVIDTPGVLASDDNKLSEKLTITASSTQTKDPEGAVYELLVIHREPVLFYYGITDENQSEEDLLELIALKLNRKISGGHADTLTTAKIILKDWQQGKIQL